MAQNGKSCVKMCLQVHARPCTSRRFFKTSLQEVAQEQRDLLLNRMYILSDLPAAANASDSCYSMFVKNIQECWQHVSTRTQMHAVPPGLRARIQHLLSARLLPVKTTDDTVRIPELQMLLHTTGTYELREQDAQHSVFVGKCALCPDSCHELVTNVPTLHLRATDNDIAATLTAVVIPEAKDSTYTTACTTPMHIQHFVQTGAGKTTNLEDILRNLGKRNSQIAHLNPHASHKQRRQQIKCTHQSACRNLGLDFDPTTKHNNNLLYSCLQTEILNSADSVAENPAKCISIFW